MPDIPKTIVEALRFYARPETYQSPSTGFSAQYDPVKPPVQEDRGAIARQALEALEAQQRIQDTP